MEGGGGTTVCLPKHSRVSTTTRLLAVVKAPKDNDAGWREWQAGAGGLEGNQDDTHARSQACGA